MILVRVAQDLNAIALRLRDPPGAPSDISIPVTLVSEPASASRSRVKSSGIVCIRTGHVASAPAGRGAYAPRSKSDAGAAASGGSSTTRCDSSGGSSMPLRSTVPSPASFGLPRSPSAAPSKQRWSVMYATSNPAARCQARLSCTVNDARASCEKFV